MCWISRITHTNWRRRSNGPAISSDRRSIYQRASHRDSCRCKRLGKLPPLVLPVSLSACSFRYGGCSDLPCLAAYAFSALGSVGSRFLDICVFCSLDSTFPRFLAACVNCLRDFLFSGNPSNALCFFLASPGICFSFLNEPLGLVPPAGGALPLHPAKGLQPSRHPFSAVA